MIPDYQTLMLPVLDVVRDREMSTKDAVSALADKFQLSEEERENLLPSGRQRTFDNRVNWAKTYLKQAGLVRYPKRGFYIATEEGKKALNKNPERIDNNFLRQYDAFLEFQARKGPQSADNKTEQGSVDDTDATPDEILRAAHKSINETTAADLIDRVRQSTPQFFESLIIELLLAMGYGGTTEDAARSLGQSGDNGVDGVIDQDPLGVDQIYVQAKRYAEGNNVGSGDVRDFFGALNLKKAQKGLFFTTSAFSPAAIQTGRDLGMRIVLIDGKQLARLMIRYNVGCRDEEVLHIKKIDEEFFE
jgi:restriction system protein